MKNGAFFIFFRLTRSLAVTLRPFTDKAKLYGISKRGNGYLRKT
jgi:hypothetical protein